MERVNGMPIRAVITKKVVDTNWIKGVYNPGEVSDWSLSNFQLFNMQHPGSIQEIEMTEQDWIDLATANALESKKRIFELQELYGEAFSSYYIRVIPSDNKKVDGGGYGGGLSDAYNKTKLLRSDIEEFEKHCIKAPSETSITDIQK